MLTRRALLLATAVLGVSAGHAAADVYPNRPVKLIVPFPPGTPSEFAIRLIADRLSARLGQPMVIEHRPGGAGGTVGAAAVASATPDGYTLLASPPGPLVTAAAIYKNLGYDPATSFAPVALLFVSPQLLAVHPGLSADTVQALVTYAKDHPGRISFASPGYGTQPHLLGEMLKAAAGIDMVHVPYKGPAPAMTDLLAGQVQIYFETAPLVLPQAQGGKLKVLAIAGNTRVGFLPDVPTMAECGFAGVTGGFWSGIVAPAGTPASIVKRLNGAMNDIMRTEALQSALTKLGAQANLGSPDDFAAFLATERSKWSAVVRAAGIQVE